MLDGAVNNVTKFVWMGWIRAHVANAPTGADLATGLKEQHGSLYFLSIWCSNMLIKTSFIIRILFLFENDYLLSGKAHIAVSCNYHFHDFVGLENFHAHHIILICKYGC